MNRRAFYRIRYPATDRPRLVLGTAICEVVDCSEQGIRFRLPEPAELCAGAPFRARLRLGCGADLPVAGTVLRQHDGTVSATLAAQGVPFREILREQLHLRALARRRIRESG